MNNIAQFRPPEVVREDTDLARGLHDREPAALRRLADRFDARLHTVARCLGVDPDVAARTSVATLLTAWTRATTIEPGDDLAPWMARMLEEQLDDVVPADEATLGRRIELVWSVADALSALDPVDQQLLRAVHVHGRGAAEVAPEVGLRADDVVGRSARAHQRLARRLHHVVGDGAAPDSSAPYVDDQGRPSQRFVAEVGDPVVALLADPAMWAPAPDHVIDEVLASAGVDASADPATGAPTTGGRRGVRSTHRSSRFRQVRAGVIGGVLTIVFLTVGIVAFSAAGEPPAVASFDAELVPTGLVPDVDGTIEVTELDGGLQIELDAPSLPRRVQGAFYEGWLRLDDDRLVPIGTFQTGIDVTLFAGIDLDDVTELVIAQGEAVAGDGPRSGPDEVVLKADLPPADS